MRKPSAAGAYQPVTTILFAGAVVLALWGAWEHYSLESARLSQQKDPYAVDMHIQRLAAITEAIPRDALVSYTSDLPPGSVAASAAFNAAAYALAPRLLVETTHGRWVLGNFSASRDYASFGRPLGIEVVQDYGNGAVLFRASGR